MKKVTKRQQHIIDELYNRDYFYTRYTHTRELVYKNLKQTYPSLRMKDVEKAIDLEINNK